MSRTPTAITETDKGWLVVACDDGTVWLHVPEGELGDEMVEAKWVQLKPAIPGSTEDLRGA